MLILLSTSTFCLSETDAQVISKFEKKFDALGQDFLAIRQAMTRLGESGLDYQCAEELFYVAEEYGIYCDFISEELYLTFRVSRRAIFDLFGRIFEDFGRQIT